MNILCDCGSILKLIDAATYTSDLYICERCNKEQMIFSEISDLIKCFIGNNFNNILKSNTWREKSNTIIIAILNEIEEKKLSDEEEIKLLIVDYISPFAIETTSSLNILNGYLYIMLEDKELYKVNPQDFSKEKIYTKNFFEELITDKKNGTVINKNEFNCNKAILLNKDTPLKITPEYALLYFKLKFITAKELLTFLD